MTQHKPTQGDPGPHGAARLGTPTARFDGRDIVVDVSRAPFGTRVFLESLSPIGPRTRIPAWAMPQVPGSATRTYRARLPHGTSMLQDAWVPISVLGADEVRGEELKRATSDQPLQTGAGAVALELLAHAEADLPTATVFGATPEGVRMAFYIQDGRWNGPRIYARYKSEGGDWLLVRKDGVAIPDARATLETDDGALLYYRLTGTLDLGPDGYSRTLANDLPSAAPLSVVAQVSTSSEQWKWLNRLTLIGSGVVDLQSGHASYDLCSIKAVTR